MSASVEHPETTAASNIDRGRRSIYKLASANATDANHQDWYFDMQDPTSENHPRNPRPANMTRREDRCGYAEGIGNNGKVQVGFEEGEEEEGGDEIDEQDEPGVVGEIGEEEAEGEEDDDD